MRQIRSPFSTILIPAIALSAALSGCLSLAEDVTPPPAVSGPTQVLAQTASPAPAVPSSTPESTTAPAEDGQTGSGIINVFLIDQTSGGLGGEGLEIRLEGYDSFDRVYEQTLPISGSELVQFSDVDFPAGRVFFASLAYGGAVYRSEIVQISEGQESLDLELLIFDTTTDQSALVIDRLHIILEYSDPGSIRVIEIYIISNLGGTTVVPDPESGISVEFPLPAGASGLEFEDGSLGQRYLATRNGFGDTVSIPPGSGVYPLSLSYLLPYPQNSLEFSQQYSLPVGAVVLMTPADVLRLKGAGLEDQGVQSIPSGMVQIYSAAPIQAGGSLEFKVSGKPDSVTALEPTGFSSSDWIIYGAGGAGVLLLASGVWLYIRNQRREREDDQSSPAADKEQILDSIIALDDLYANDEISESDYQRKRKQLKDRLKAFSKD